MKMIEIVRTLMYYPLVYSQHFRGTCSPWWFGDQDLVAIWEFMNNSTSQNSTLVFLFYFPFFLLLPEHHFKWQHKNILYCMLIPEPQSSAVSQKIWNKFNCLHVFTFQLCSLKRVKGRLAFTLCVSIHGADETDDHSYQNKCQYFP